MITCEVCGSRVGVTGPCHTCAKRRTHQGRQEVKHALQHAIEGCSCAMRDISACVICGKPLERNREHTDTCGERCFKRLLRQQEGEKQ